MNATWSAAFLTVCLTSYWWVPWLLNAVKLLHQASTPWCDACALRSHSIPHVPDCAKGGVLRRLDGGAVEEFGVRQTRGERSITVTRKARTVMGDQSHDESHDGSQPPPPPPVSITRSMEKRARKIT